MISMIYLSYKGGFFMPTAVSIRLPKELSQALDDLAASLDRPKTYLVRKALETYLAEYADYQIALDRLRDKDDAVLSSAEMKKSLGL
jgi:RHH-type rel operon transcriptional repressor/antitoxin RelB